MKRREVLKGLGLSMGYVVAAPAVLSLLQSCKNHTSATIEWNPIFLTEKQGVILTKLVDLIIPKTTDSPGAVDLNVHKFIDAYANEVMTIENQEWFKKGMEAITAVFGKNTKEIKTEDYNVFLSNYLKPNVVLDNVSDEKEKMILSALLSIRGLTAWAFQTSEEIGEKVMVYDPVPGVFNGCISLQDVTGGKGWSINE